MTQIGKNHGATRKFIIVKEITLDEERISQLLCMYSSILTLASVLDPNDDTSSFIEKTKATSYEITKLHLKRSPSFTGYESFRLDRFSAVHL